MIDCTQIERIKPEFYEGVEKFITTYIQTEQFTCEGTIRCPCRKCKCRKFLDIASIRYNIYKDKFKPDYWVLTEHGPIVMLEVVQLGGPCR